MFSLGKKRPVLILFALFLFAAIVFLIYFLPKTKVKGFKSDYLAFQYPAADSVVYDVDSNVLHVGNMLTMSGRFSSTGGDHVMAVVPSATVTSPSPLETSTYSQRKVGGHTLTISSSTTTRVDATIDEGGNHLVLEYDPAQQKEVDTILESLTFTPITTHTHSGGIQ